MPDFENASKTAFAGRFTSGPATVACLALFILIIHLAAAGMCGLFVDELYFLACGEHLAWSYVDIPPLTAFQTCLNRALFRDSMLSIRLFPALAGAGWFCPLVQLPLLWPCHCSNPNPISAIPKPSASKSRRSSTADPANCPSFLPTVSAGRKWRLARPGSTIPCRQRTGPRRPFSAIITVNAVPSISTARNWDCSKPSATPSKLLVLVVAGPYRRSYDCAGSRPSRTSRPILQ